MSFTIKHRGAAPALKIIGWICRDCEGRGEWSVWERRLTPSEVEANEPCRCEKCESFNTEEYVGTMAPPKVIVEGNHDFAARQRDRLYARSSEHFKREGREEAIERQRAQFKREGMVQ